MMQRISLCQKKINLHFYIGMFKKIYIVIYNLRIIEYVKQNEIFLFFLVFFLLLQFR